MAELDEVTLVAGIPQESGTVPTLAVVRDALLAGTVGTGTAGSPNANVVTMQGATSMTPVIVQGVAAMTPLATAIESSSITAAGTGLTPKFAAIAASTSGNNTLVAAVTSKKIRVLAASFVASAAVNAKFQSGASGTDLTGLYYNAANGGVVLPFNPVGWFESASGVLLNLNLSAANAVGGSLTYIEV